MAERVAAAGGHLEAGPRPGWRLGGPDRASALGGDGVVTVKVVIADDEALVRSGLRWIVDSADGLEVVGEASDGGQAVELALTRRPDVVLMDIRMDRLDGIEATRRLLATAGASAPASWS